MWPFAANFDMHLGNLVSICMAVTTEKMGTESWQLSQWSVEDHVNLTGNILKHNCRLFAVVRSRRLIDWISLCACLHFFFMLSWWEDKRSSGFLVDVWRPCCCWWDFLPHEVWTKYYLLIKFSIRIRNWPTISIVLCFLLSNEIAKTSPRKQTGGKKNHKNLFCTWYFEGKHDLCLDLGKKCLHNSVSFFVV